MFKLRMKKEKKVEKKNKSICDYKDKVAWILIIFFMIFFLLIKFGFLPKSFLNIFPNIIS